MEWTIDPFVGANQIKFGMPPIDVNNVIGETRNVIDRSSGYVNYYYRDASYPVIGFQDGFLVDITFGRWTEALFFDGLDYFRTPPAVFLDRVRSHDPNLKRDVLGNITSFALGLGFDTVALGESDKTIMAFARCEIDAYWKFGPFTPA